MNLLEETKRDLERFGKSPGDIEYIGSLSGYCCTWAEFETLANLEYDRGFGTAEIATDLVILFRDRTWMERGEYDGSEWWEYRTPPVPPPMDKRKPITVLKADLWRTLKEMHEPEHDAGDLF